MNTYDLSADPMAVEAQQIERRRQLAELLMQQSTSNAPVYSNRAGVARLLGGMIAGGDRREAERQETDLANRRTAARKDEMEQIFTASQGGGRGDLAKLLAKSSNPALSQAGLQMLLQKPKEDEPYTLAEGAVRYGKDGKLVASNPKADKPEGPKMGEMRKRIVGGEEIQEELTKDGWKEVGRGPRWQPHQKLPGDGPPKAPAGYKWTTDGGLEPIKGGPADPDTVAARRGAPTPNEDERRSAGLAVRMENAIQTMSKFPKSGKPELFAEGVRNFPLVGNEPMANAATSSGRQQVEAAQLDALDAALTLATGAAYTKEQLHNLRKSYFPQLGDSTATEKAKEENLLKVIETARIRAGRASGDIARVSGGPAKIQSDDEYNVLPSGATFVGPDGKTRRKP